MKTKQLQKNKWSELTLENIMIPKGMVRGPFGGALKKDFFVSKGYKVYEQKNAIYQSVNIGEYYIDKNKFSELKRFSVKPGDFIISCSGTIGKIFQIPDSAPEGVINQALLKVTIDKSKVNERFFYYHFILPKFQSLVIDSTQGGAMQNLVGMEIFRETIMTIPELQEQNRIVSVLDVWDKSIEKLTQKIEAKKRIKKGLIQDLLNGKKRLPGFSNKWEVSKIHEIFDIKKGSDLSKEKLDANGKFLCILYGELYTTYTEIIGKIKSKTNMDEGTVSHKGDILIPASTTTRAIDLAVASCLSLENVRLGGDINILRPKKKIDSRFFAYYLTHTKKHNLARLAQGVTIVHLYGSDFKKLEIEVPSIDEQIKIAEILISSENEIAGLEKKLQIIEDQKKYLLNNLITGTIRTPETLSTKITK